MSTPAERVAEFVRQYERQTYPPDHVQTVHTREERGGPVVDVHLELDDLRGVLDAPLSRAVGAVLALHQDDGGTCTECGSLDTFAAYPCPTVLAVRAALGGES